MVKNLPERNPQEGDDQESMDDNEDEQTSSLPPKKRLKQHDRRPPNHKGSSSEIHSCNVCQKSFASLKALNGHMKIHGGSKSKATRPPYQAPEPSEEKHKDDDGASASSSSYTNIKKDIDVASFLQNLSDIEIQRNGPNGPRAEGYCWQQSSRDNNAEDRLGYVSGKKAMPVPYKDNPSSKKVKIDGTSSTGSDLVQKKLAGGTRKASVEDDDNGDQSRVPKDFTSNTSKKVKSVDRGEDPKGDMVSHDQTRKLQIPRKPHVESSKTFSASQARETYSWTCKSSRSATASVKMGESGFGTKYAAKSSTSLKMGESGFGAKYGTKSNTSLKIGHSGFGTKYAAKSNTSVKVGESGFGTKLAARAPTSTKEAAVKDKKQHVCEICHRTFKSYQGLGGHMRIHNSKGGVAKEAPTAPEVRAATGHEDGDTGVDPQGHRSVGSSRRVSVRKAPAAPEVREPSEHEDGESDEDPEAALHEEEAGAKAEGRHERGFNLNQFPDEDSDGAA